jgi:hypothetical protein
MTARLDRRAVSTLLGGAAAWLARAQQTSKLPTIGFLGSTTPASQSELTAAFLQRLRELGWIEGRTVAIEYTRRKVDMIGSRSLRPVWSAIRSA